MTESTSPVKRLLNITTRLRNADVPEEAQYAKRRDGNYVIGPIICAYLGAEQDDNNQYDIVIQFESWKFILSLCDHAGQFVMSTSAPRARSVNMGTLSSITQIYRSMSPHDLLLNFTNMNQEILARAEQMMLNLDDKYDETIIPDEQIREVMDAAQNLIRVILASDLDNRIKDHLIAIITPIITQLYRVNLIGADDLVRSLDTLLGTTVRAATASKSSTNVWEVVQQVTTFIAAVATVVDVNVRMYPDVQQLGQNIMNVLTNGSN